MTRRPTGRLRRIAVLSIAIAVLASVGALSAPAPQFVPHVLARTLAGDGSADGERDARTPREPSATHPPDTTPTPPPAPTPAEEPSFASARVAPHLELVAPTTSGVRVNANVFMDFSQPMDQASVEASFVIRPKVEGRFSWQGNTLTFEPFRLAYATTYQAEVRGHSTRGKPLAGSRGWTFSTEAAPPEPVSVGPRSIKVPVLMYHYVRVNPDPRDSVGFALSVTPANFAAQMEWLARNDYHPITTEDLYAYLNRTRGLPSKPVILTFDDGYADFYTTALPILRSNGFKATSYVVSGFVGRGGYMTADQIREADHSGIEIGSHSVTHANLARGSAANVSAEVGNSKRSLEQLLGHPVTSFCYPSGKYTPAVGNAVAAAGYHDATTTASGSWHSLPDRYAWTRMRVSGHQPLGDFAAAIVSAS
jgi:peptidoglycan/xylan/chitin deacetylase (PgdA/CDA1 family)